MLELHCWTKVWRGMSCSSRKKSIETWILSLPRLRWTTGIYISSHYLNSIWHTDCFLGFNLSPNLLGITVLSSSRVSSWPGRNIQGRDTCLLFSEMISSLEFTCKSAVEKRLDIAIAGFSMARCWISVITWLGVARINSFLGVSRKSSIVGNETPVSKESTFNKSRLPVLELRTTGW